MPHQGPWYQGPCAFWPSHDKSRKNKTLQYFFSYSWHPNAVIPSDWRGNCREASTRISSNAKEKLNSIQAVSKAGYHSSFFSVLMIMSNIILKHLSYPSQPFHKTCFHRNAYKFTPVTSCPTFRGHRLSTFPTKLSPRWPYGNGVWTIRTLA